MNRRILNLIIQLLTALSKYTRYVFKRQSYSKLIKICKLPEATLPKSKSELKREYIAKWGKLTKQIDFEEVLYFARYIGYDVNILTESVSHNEIEPVLNPVRFRDYYRDKNIFNKLFHKEVLAQTFLRKMGGGYYDVDYEPLNSLSDAVLAELLGQSLKVIIKPTIDSNSGNGITVWERGSLSDKFTLIGSENAEYLTMEYLSKNYGDDFAIMEFLTQSPYISQFNKSSVNTLRMLAYRSVVDDKVHVLNCIIRIGAENSVVDNAHAGGIFVGVFPNGELGKYTCNQYGQVDTIHNGVDFSEMDYTIPNYDRVIEFVEDMSKQIPHQRLVNWDIMLDENNNPRIVEFNINVMSTWLFQTTTSSAFGDYTDEIIDYCAKNREKAEIMTFY